MVKKPSSMKLPTFTIDTSRVQSGFHGPCGQSDRTPFNDCDQLSQPASNRMSFLTVPSSPLRRPSTADVVIQKLKVERLEGGGLSVSGVALAANCHLSLIIFGAFFLLAGLVLSYIGFADKTNESVVAQAAGAPHGTFEKANTHRQMQIIGPVFLIVGLLMFMLGVTMYAIGRKIRLDEKDNRATVSALQLRQLESSFSHARDMHTCSPIHTFTPQINEAQPVMSLRRGSWWIDPASALTPDIKCQEDQPPPYPEDSPRESPKKDTSDRVASPPQYLHQTLQGQSQNAATVQLPTALNTDGITTYPENFGVASFPVRFDQTLDLAGRRHSTTSNSSLHSSSPRNVFEVQECPENEEVKNQTGSNESLSSKEDQDNKINENDSDEEKKESPNPHIQVAHSSLETLANVANSPSNVANNLQLSKNGVALPRLSRHSISSRGDMST